MADAYEQLTFALDGLADGVEPLWMVADYCDGPRLFAWIRSLPNYWSAFAEDKAVRRRLERWSGGSRAQIWTVDSLLVPRGFFLFELPPEVFIPPNGRMSEEELEERMAAAGVAA